MLGKGEYEDTARLAVKLPNGSQRKLVFTPTVPKLLIGTVLKTLKKLTGPKKASEFSKASTVNAPPAGRRSRTDSRRRAMRRSARPDAGRRFRRPTWAPADCPRGTGRPGRCRAP